MKVVVGAEDEAEAPFGCPAGTRSVEEDCGVLADDLAIGASSIGVLPEGPFRTASCSAMS